MTAEPRYCRDWRDVLDIDSLPRDSEGSSSRAADFAVAVGRPPRVSLRKGCAESVAGGNHPLAYAGCTRLHQHGPPRLTALSHQGLDATIGAVQAEGVPAVQDPLLVAEVLSVGRTGALPASEAALATLLGSVGSGTRSRLERRRPADVRRCRPTTFCTDDLAPGTDLDACVRELSPGPNAGRRTSRIRRRSTTPVTWPGWSGRWR